MSSNFLEINNATFIASDNNKVKNVSLKIKEKGEIVCLLGPSGVGKTTTFAYMCGYRMQKVIFNYQKSQDDESPVTESA